MLNGQQFFHATSADLAVGDVLKPQGRRRKYDDRPRGVYVSELTQAIHPYGSHVYEVEPLGPLVEDDATAYAHITPSARIVRKGRFENWGRTADPKPVWEDE